MNRNEWIQILKREIKNLPPNNRHDAEKALSEVLKASPGSVEAFIEWADDKCYSFVNLNDKHVPFVTIWKQWKDEQPLPAAPGETVAVDVHSLIEELYSSREIQEHDLGRVRAFKVGYQKALTDLQQRLTNHSEEAR